MTTAPAKPKSNSKALALQIKTAPSLVAFSSTDLENAIRTALPGGNRLSTDQVRGIALAGQTTDLNPLLKELHATDIGVIKAAAADASWANEWLRATGEREPDFSYHTPGAMTAKELAEALAGLNIMADPAAPIGELTTQLYTALRANISHDIVVLVKMHRFSTRSAWLETIKTLRDLGVDKADIIREYGISPRPDYCAWGIVRRSEYRDTAEKGVVKKTGEQKWVEANESYSHFERAKKRGRTACYRACLPVTAAQIRRQREGTKETRVIDARQAPAQQAPAPAGAESPLPKFDIVDGASSLVPAGVAVGDADADDDIDAGTEGTDIIDAGGDGDDNEATETEGAGEQPEPQGVRYLVPAALADSAQKIGVLAESLRAQGKGANEKQDKLISINIGKLTNKDDDLRAALLHALTGCEHYGDIDAAARLALLNAWLALVKPEGDGFPEPCQRARQDVAALKAAMNGKSPAQQITEVVTYIDSHTLSTDEARRAQAKAIAMAQAAQIDPAEIANHTTPDGINDVSEIITHTKALFGAAMKALTPQPQQ